MNYGTEVILDGRIVSRSANLRGMLDYARVSHVVRFETRKRDAGGELAVTYANGATCTALFADHSMMIDWTRSRRSWHCAEFVHHDGALGYLTAPGSLA